MATCRLSTHDTDVRSWFSIPASAMAHLWVCYEDPDRRTRERAPESPHVHREDEAVFLERDYAPGGLARSVRTWMRARARAVSSPDSLRSECLLSVWVKCKCYCSSWVARAFGVDCDLLGFAMCASSPQVVRSSTPPRRIHPHTFRGHQIHPASGISPASTYCGLSWMQFFVGFGTSSSSVLLSTLGLTAWWKR